MPKAKISDIKITERIRKEITNIEELAADIQEIGLLNPITVMQEESGELRLLAGLRRLKAVESIGRHEIDVNIVAPPDAEAALLIEVSENEQRVNFVFSEKMDFARMMEVIEVANAKSRMADGGKCRIMREGVFPGTPLQLGKCRDKVAKKIGMSGITFTRAKYIADNAPPEIIEQLDRGERTIRPTYDELRSKEKAANLHETPNASDVNNSNEAQNTAPSLAERSNSNNDIKACPSDDSAESIENCAQENKKPARIPKPLTSKDHEAQQKISDFNALSPKKKIEVLQEQLRQERARAAGAESELRRERELHHNTKYHSELSISNLEGQVADLAAKVSELTKALEKATRKGN